MQSGLLQVVKAVILEVCMLLFTQLSGDQVPAAENTTSEEQYVEYHLACALQQDF